MIRNYKTICEYFKNEHSRTLYCSILDVTGRSLLERVYAYRFRKSDKKPKVKEVLRINMKNGEMHISDDLYYGSMCGYYTLFESRTYSSWGSYYGDMRPTNTMRKIKEMVNLPFTRHLIQYRNILETNSMYKEYLDSFSRAFEKSICSLYHYHQKLHKYPTIEYFLKLGLSHLVSDSRILRKAQDDSKFRKFLIDNRSFICDQHLNYTKILNGYKSGVSLIASDILVRISSIVDMTNKALIKKIVEYLNDKDVGIYVDYVQMQNKLGMVIDYFPKELSTKHNELHLKILEKEDTAKAEMVKIKNNFNKTTIGNMEFVPLKTIEEFKEEGGAMHHCVYSMKYYEKEYALIMSVRDAKDKHRLETIEIDLTKMKLIQSRGIRNTPTENHEKIIGLVNRKLLPRLKQMIAANTA